MSETNDDWTKGPLHKALVEALPAFVKDPFSDAPKLHVSKLYMSLGMSNGGLYRWLNEGRVTRIGAEKLFALAHSPANQEALSKLGRKVPDADYFMRLCFSLG